MNTDFIRMLERDNFVILDTETTGLERPAEICQIAIIDAAEKTLLNTLVKVHNFIPAGATAVHGIDTEMTDGYDTWPVVREQVLDIIHLRDVIVYNAVYDRKLMHWSDEMYDDEHIDYRANASWFCAMEAYAEFHGERHPHYGSYKWQSLTAACRQMGIRPEDAHHALGDCLSTLALIRRCTPQLALWDLYPLHYE